MGPHQGVDVAPIPGTEWVRYLEENADAVPRDAVVAGRHEDMSSIDS